MKVHVMALLYGDHFILHQRLLQGLERVTNGHPMTIWCNQVCEATKKILRDFEAHRDINTVVIHSADNVRKYEVMRRIMLHNSGTRPDWRLWLDDDVHFVNPDWFTKTLEYIESKKAENVCYIGQPWFVDYLPGQLAFVQAATWYKGLPPTAKKNKFVIEFAQGSYWWLRSDVAAQLNWPDPRLAHNGGDTLLGEAIRQQGLPFHKFNYGVRPNAAPRRGLSERPAGSTVDARR